MSQICIKSFGSSRITQIPKSRILWDYVCNLTNEVRLILFYYNITCSMHYKFLFLRKIIDSLCHLHPIQTADIYADCFRKFRDLRTEQFCDVFLIVSDKKIFAHKLILAASSSYFENLFFGPFLESNKKEIEIKEVNFEALNAVIDFMYSEKIDINADNVYEIYGIADMYQMDVLKKLCSTLLKPIINMENCLKIWSISRQCLSEELETETRNLIVLNLTFLSNKTEFLNLSAEEVSELVSDYKYTGADTHIGAAINWTRHDQNTRMEFLITFLEAIPKDKISKAYLTDELSTNELIIKEKSCMRWLLEIYKEKCSAKAI